MFSIYGVPNPSQYKWEGLYRLTNQPKKTKIKSLHVASSYSFTRNRMNTSGFCTFNVSTWYWSPMGCTPTCIAWASSRSTCVLVFGCSLRPIAAASASWPCVTRRSWGRYVAQHGFSSSWLRDPLARLFTFEWPLVLNPQCFRNLHITLEQHIYASRICYHENTRPKHCLKAWGT